MRLEQILTRWAHRDAAGETPSPPPLLAGRWRNEHGSVLELTIDGDRLGGTFVAAIGDARVSGPISGYVRGDIVAFAVLWPASTRSLAAWVGQLVDEHGAPVLKTNWHLVLDVPDDEEPSAQWATVLTGADTFR